MVRRCGLKRMMRRSCAVLLLLVLGCARAYCGDIRTKYDGNPDAVLTDFLSALSNDDVNTAYALIAPSTKRLGDPIAYLAPVDREAFATEVAARPPAKFAAYRIGKRRSDGPNRVRLFVHFTNGDNDETLLLREGDRWYVADPVHIIR